MEQDNAHLSDLFGAAKKSEGRSEEYKNLIKTPSLNDCKRKRDDVTESIRKKNREERFKTRRMGDGEEFIEPVQDVPPSNTNPTQLSEPTHKEILSRLSSTLVNFKEKNKEKNLEGLRTIRQLLSYKSYTPTQEVIDVGLIPIMLSFAAQEDPELQVLQHSHSS
jgi:hypothetical protein